MSDAPCEPFDLLIIGGGINGVGIARDAAGRGLRVALCEMDDLAAATSWTSSKLVHGGLRYLEHFEFRLVRESLAEREALLAIAPHLVTPLRFVMPHAPGLRPAWMLRAGLFLYDRLSRRDTLPGSRSIDLATSDEGACLKSGFRRGFSYYDCRVDDARLVILNARDAADHGATVLTRTRFPSATREATCWRAVVEDSRTGHRRELRARLLVNATGPWVTRTLDALPGAERHHRMRLVKGSHIVVPRLYVGEHAFILQNDDKRVVFVIPFENDYSLIGTTDVVVSGTPESATVSDDEVVYLCRAVNRYMARPANPDDVVWSYSGVRPLFDDGEAEASRVTRDYALELDTGDGRAPILDVYGGKLTTYRKLSERAVDKLGAFLPSMGPAWTATTPLPGGDLPEGGMDALIAHLAERFPAHGRDLLAALVHRHGGLAAEVLAGADGDANGSGAFGANLHAFEVDYMVRREWAQEVDDVLWRRTKAGLRLGAAARDRLAAYLAQHPDVHRGRAGAD
jgi:glycerol-3-phosphate dehydrogenase